MTSSARARLKGGTRSGLDLADMAEQMDAAIHGTSVALQERRPKSPDRALRSTGLVPGPSGGTTDDQGPTRTQSKPRLAVLCQLSCLRGRGRQQCCGHAVRRLAVPPPGCSDIQRRSTLRARLCRMSPNRETVPPPEIAPHMAP